MKKCAVTRTRTKHVTTTMNDQPEKHCIKTGLSKWEQKAAGRHKKFQQQRLIQFTTKTAQEHEPALEKQFPKKLAFGCIWCRFLHLCMNVLAVTLTGGVPGIRFASVCTYFYSILFDLFLNSFICSYICLFMYLCLYYFLFFHLCICLFIHFCG